MTKFIAVTRNSYGVGQSIPEAKANCRKYAGSSTIKTHGLIVYLVDDATTVSEIDGSLSYPVNGFAPIKLEDTRKVRA